MYIVKTFIKSILRSLDNELLETSGFVAYTALIAFFPFIFLLISVASLFGQTEQVQGLILNIQLHLPQEVNDVVMPVVESIFEGPATSLITLSILCILWIASSGIESIRIALNKAYETSETRSFFFRRTQSLVLIVFLVIIVLLLSFCLVLVPVVVAYVPGIKDDFYVIQFMVTILNSLNIANWVEYVLTTGVISLIFSACYYGLPDHQKTTNPTFPGSILAASLCVFFSNIFSYYIQNFTTYNAVYKTLGGVVILLLFMQFSTYFFLLGAQFNRELARQRTLLPR